MSRRTKIIIAIIVILLLLLFGALLLLGGPAQQGPTLAVPANANSTSGVGLINGTISINSGTIVNQAPAPAPVPLAPPDPGTGARQLAKSFAERYGSFSNQSDFENLLDLKVFMSAAMAARVDAFIAAEKKKPPAQFYAGTTTRSINVELTAFDDKAGTATAVVKTQRQEFTDPTGNPAVFYQDIVIELVRENGVWKVDSATWQPK